MFLIILIILFTADYISPPTECSLTYHHIYIRIHRCDLLIALIFGNLPKLIFIRRVNCYFYILKTFISYMKYR